MTSGVVSSPRVSGIPSNGSEPARTVCPRCFLALVKVLRTCLPEDSPFELDWTRNLHEPSPLIGKEGRVLVWSDVQDAPQRSARSVTSPPRRRKPQVHRASLTK